MMNAKMYILIKDSVDLGHAILGAAHASLSGYLTWEEEPCGDDYFDMAEYVVESFRKVVCKVSNKEFEKAMTYGEENVDYRVMTEMALGGGAIALVFRPRKEWPNFFKSLKLYK